MSQAPHSPIRVALLWIVILGAASAVVFRDQLLPLADIPLKAAAEPAVKDARLDRFRSDFLSRYLTGFKAEAKAAQKERPELPKDLNVGSLRQRFCYVAIVAEFHGRKAAHEALTQLDLTDASDADRASYQILDRLLTDGELNDDERRFLVKDLGWSGELLLNPEVQGQPDSPARLALLDSAKMLFEAVLWAGVTVLVGGLTGTILLLMLLFRWLRGAAESRFGPISPHFPIYGETFCLWLVVFFGLALSLPGTVGTISAFGASLFVLAWPIVRGVSWAQMKGDLGLHTGVGLFTEISNGIAAYCIMLPFAFVGLAIFLGVTYLRQQMQGRAGFELKGGDVPTHPVFENMGGGMSMLELYLLIAVVAPIVEEIFFRGVLYRFLRDSTRGCCQRSSFLVAALVNSVIFAALHPQGLAAIPLLAGVALGLTLARERRGSLIAPIVAHGINNALVLTMLGALMG